MIISIFDAIEVLYTESPSGNKTVQSQNLVHLDSCDQSAAALSNDVTDWGKEMSTDVFFGVVARLTSVYVGQLGREWRCARRVAELNLGHFLLSLHISQTIRNGIHVELKYARSAAGPS